MMNDEITQPPVRKPNTPRNMLRRAWFLAKSYPDVSIPAAALFGLIVGAGLF